MTSTSSMSPSEQPVTVKKTFYAPDGKSKTLDVELFTWEKLDFVDRIKKKIKILINEK